MRTARRVLLIIAAGMWLMNAARADDFLNAFDAANRLYVDGRFAEAADGYRAILQTGNFSEAIYFNEGNALFRQGKIGLAIAAYRQAELLAPRDRDLRANLQFARTRARGGTAYHAPRLQSWLGRLSLNEWTALVAAGLWVFFVLLALSQWRRELGARLRIYWIVAGIFVVLAASGLAVELNAQYFSKSAIVVVGETDVRNGPFDEAPSVYKVRDGAELSVADRKDNWFQVVDSAMRTGWIKGSDVALFPPENKGS